MTLGILLLLSLLFLGTVSYRPSWSQTCSLFALASQIFRLEGCYTMPGSAVTLLWNFDKYILMSYCFLYKSLNYKILQTLDLSYLYLIKYFSKHCFLCRNMAADLFFPLTLTFNYTTLFIPFSFLWHPPHARTVPSFSVPGCCWLRVSGPLKNACHVH